MIADQEPLQRVFSQVNVEHCFEVLDDNSSTFRSDLVLHIRAEMPARFYDYRYTWTGTDHTDATEIDCEHDLWGQPLQRLHGPVIREGATRTIVVDLGRTLEKGAMTTIRLRHNPRDMEKTFQPIAGFRAKPGTEKIVLEVILPESLAKGATYRETMSDTNHDVDKVSLMGEPLAGKRIKYSKTILTPAQTNRLYQINWGHLAGK